MNPALWSRAVTDWLFGIGLAGWLAGCLVCGIWACRNGAMAYDDETTATLAPATHAADGTRTTVAEQEAA